nr:DUF2971 domain-containing protein [Tardiphaga robiniae]
MRKIVRENKNKFNEEKGLICFSEDWTDPVLWSHYAAKHTGIALGFDIDESLISKVDYSEKRLKQKLPKGSKALTPDLVKLLVETKFDSWKYEREWRMLSDLTSVTNEGSLYFEAIGPQLRLVEVILGPLCNFDVKQIRKIVDANHKGVITYKARLANRSFRIIPQGNTVQRTLKRPTATP